MLSSSSTLNNSTSTTSPIFYVDNIVSYLIDDDSTNYSTSYFHLPSPLIYNEFDNFGDFITNNNHDELAIIQQSWLANTNDDNNNNNNNNNINKSIDHTGDSSILEVDHKVVYSNKSGDHEVEVNGIVEDNVEMNHNISSSTTTTTNSHHHNHHHHHGLIIKKKRRTSNKDRHSKIRTAHGLRDRRMRLSLQVARPFFKLQDLLGFDKASTTVEWLLMQSKPSIDELLQAKLGSPSSGVTTTTRCNTTVSSNSDDCDVESTTNEEREANNNHPTQKQVIKDEPKKKEKRKRTTKEERLVARERAKKRTLERMQIRGNNPFTNFSNFQQNFDDACQKNVPSYRFSTQHNIMEGPR